MGLKQQRRSFFSSPRNFSRFPLRCSGSRKFRTRMKWSNTLMLIRRLRFVDSLLVVYELPLSVQKGGEAALLKSQGTCRIAQF
jgi:hypothetical protein